MDVIYPVAGFSRQPIQRQLNGLRPQARSSNAPVYRISRTGADKNHEDPKPLTRGSVAGMIHCSNSYSGGIICLKCCLHVTGCIFIIRVTQ